MAESLNYTFGLLPLVFCENFTFLQEDWNLKLQWEVGLSCQLYNFLGAISQKRDTANSGLWLSIQGFN